MKVRLWAAALIFLSSYAPLGAILLIKDWDATLRHLKNPAWSLGLFAVLLLSVVVVLVAVRSIKGGDPVTLTRIRNQSGELVNYTVPYMISFFDFDLGKWQDVTCFGLFMMMMFILTLRTQNIFVNPVLALAGYNLYDVEFEEGTTSKEGTFLCKGELARDGRAVVRRVSTFFYFVTSQGLGGQDGR